MVVLKASEQIVSSNTKTNIVAMGKLSALVVVLAVAASVQCLVGGNITLYTIIISFFLATALWQT